MLRHTHIALLVVLALTTGTLAQEPVYGLLPHESTITSDVMSAETAPTEHHAADPLWAKQVSTQLDAAGAYNFPSQAAGPFDGAYAGLGDCASCGTGLDVAYGGGCDKCFDGCCGGCCQMFRASFNSVVLDRISSDRSQLVLQDVTFAGGAVATSRTLIGAGDVETRPEAGVDFSLYAPDGYGADWQLRILYLNEFDDTFRRTGSNVELNNAILANGLQPVITLNPLANLVLASARLESDFRTLELIYREPFAPGWIVSAGFRYVNLEEDLRIRTADSATVPLTSNTNYLTRNHMFGFQMGTELVLATNPSGWEIRGTAKAGIYFNDQEVQVGDFTSRLVGGGGRGRDVTGESAFLGEFGLQAYYHLSPTTSLQIGYQGIVVDGVAVATEQVAGVLNPLMGPDLLVTANSGTLFYQGANAGIEVRW